MRSLKPISGSQLFDRAKRAAHGAQMHLREQNYYAVAPEDLLYVWDVGDGNSPRFAQHFRDVWTKLPAVDRVRINSYWRRSGFHQVLGALGIPISLEANSSFRRERRSASCEAAGRALTFYARIVDVLPPRYVRILIAHELAHVLQAAEGKLSIPSEPTRDQIIMFGENATRYAIRESECERGADRIAREWGYDCAAYERFVQKIGWEALPKDRY